MREILRDNKGVEEREIEWLENAGMSKFACVEVIVSDLEEAREAWEAWDMSLRNQFDEMKANWGWESCWEPCEERGESSKE